MTGSRGVTAELANGSVPAGGASLRAEGISMTYRSRHGGLVALDNVSLDLSPGMLGAVVGPSGCGKSTLLMVIAGLYKPTSGAVEIDGAGLAGPSRSLGMVFQRDALLDWRTVLDNVLLPITVKHLSKRAYRDEALKLLQLVGLSGFEDSYPDALSGGMRQRVAICRALVHHPRLLLMDEPFASVDALTREHLNFDLLRLTAGMSTTVVLVTHSIDEAVLLSDRILVMTQRPGRVLRTIENDLPKPRTLATTSLSRYQDIVHGIRSAFHSMDFI